VEFIFKGFRDTNATRCFAFECVGSDRSRTNVTINADMIAAKKYNILLQDLPLLCRGMLQANQDTVLPASMTFSEHQMSEVQAALLQKAADRKPPRRGRVSPLTGQAWRTGPMPQV
jgi:hypothetical protein